MMRREILLFVTMFEYYSSCSMVLNVVNWVGNENDILSSIIMMTQEVVDLYGKEDDIINEEASLLSISPTREVAH